ncbi:hypothetical protein RN001_014735 [Aquatica leii]|uniref:Cyclic nucleotide-binding domain-containing protein n=1 Tax=Aquatica leii TaxID=1421715 RepID=A0AAN7P2B7_9COLE|nr:hypothetical protein RN001_014735 [Aquatica leii]
MSRHDCILQNTLASPLPKLPPRSSKFRKWTRNIREYFMVSEENTDTKFFFRSKASIRAEKQRQFRQCKPYIIHPCSKFRWQHEILMSVLWFSQLLKNPFAAAFYSHTLDGFTKSCWKIVDVTVDTYLCVNVLICFLTGVPKKQTNEVILEPKKIAKHYLSTYFICDLFGVLPINYLLHLLDYEYHFSTYILACCCLLQFIRLKTAIQYFRKTRLFRCTQNAYRIFSLAVTALFIVHWSACYIYIIPKLLSESNGGILFNDSWLNTAKIQPMLTNVTISHRYIQCFLTAFCHIFAAGDGQYPIINWIECYMFSAIMIGGFVLYCYIIATVLEMLVSNGIFDLKYDELMNRIKKYTERNNLSTTVQKRLKLYYKHQYQRHYFKERIIFNSLSEHLRDEIILHDCKRLVEKSMLFKRLSKKSLGLIISCLKREIFLPGDVILNKDKKSIYFVSYGNVAVTLSSGHEYGHCEDGDCFGFVSVFVGVAEDMKIDLAVALELSELYSLDKKDLDRCIIHDEQIYYHFYQYAKERYYTILRRVESTRDCELDHADVLYQLRNGQILEHNSCKRKYIDTKEVNIL